MPTDHDLQRRLETLERTVRRQRLGLGALALALGVIGLASWRSAYPEIVRAQRFVAMDDRGLEVGDFGFKRHGETRVVGWNLDDHASGATAFCQVGRDPEEGSPADKGFAGFQMEAGWAISQHFVREIGDTCALSFVTGQDEKSAVGLSARGPTSELRLAAGPLVVGQDGEEDNTRSLRLAYDEEGPSITGVDPEGATKIDIR